MLESVLKFDQELLLQFNNLPHPYFLVLISLIFSKIAELGLVWFTIAIMLVFYKKSQWGIIGDLFIVLITTYYIVQGVLKPIVGRLRPEFVFKEITVYAQINNDYFSFPSGHAATSFAASFILSKVFPKGRLLFYILAFVISFSRVYLGVHYFLDVLGGSIIGIVIGAVAVKLLQIKPKKLAKTVAVIFLLFILSTRASYAKTVMNIDQNYITIYEEEQVLGVTSSDTIAVSEESKSVFSVVGNLINIASNNGKIHVNLGENPTNGNQEVDQISVQSAKNQMSIISDRGKLVIKEKIAQASTDLPILIEQSTGKIIADTGVDKKILKILPMDVINGLKDSVPLTLELKNNGAKLEYVVTQTKQKKFLGVIPITANITTTVSAETGEVNNKFSPWISKFLF